MAIAVLIDTWIFLSSVIGHSDRGSFRPRVDLSNVSPSRHQVQPTPTQVRMHVATAHRGRQSRHTVTALVFVFTWTHNSTAPSLTTAEATILFLGGVQPLSSFWVQRSANAWKGLLQECLFMAPLVIFPRSAFSLFFF